jgi:hypothetical protein
MTSVEANVLMVAIDALVFLVVWLWAAVVDLRARVARLERQK